MQRAGQILTEILCVLLFAAVASAAPPMVTTNPTVSPSKTPLGSGFSLMPNLSTVSPSCVGASTVLNLKGTSLGSTAQGRRVVVSDQSQIVDLQLQIWGSAAIQAQWKDPGRLNKGAAWEIGLMTTKGAWASNRLSIRPCSTKSKFSVRGLSDIALPPLERRESTSPGGSATHGSEDSGDSYGDDSSDSQVFVPQSGGSLLGSAMPAPPQVKQRVLKQDTSVEPNELVLVSADMDEAMKLAQLLQAQGISVKRRRALSGLGFVLTVFRVSPELPLGEILEMVRASFPDVWIDANHRYELQGAARTYGPELVALKGAGANCGRGVRVGLIDSGVDVKHSSLKGKKIETKSFLTGSASSDLSHGTAIAGILVGDDPENQFSGLVQGVELYVAEVMRGTQKNNVDATAEGITLGLDWLVQKQVAVINLSLGGKRNLLLEMALLRVMSKKIHIVAAAGNGGPKAGSVFPAAQPGVLAVSAVDARMRVYKKANRGKYVAFAAPGVDLWVPKVGRGGQYRSGTSYAAPFVTAALAIRLQQRESEPLKALAASAKDLGEPGRDPVFGWGLTQSPGACP